MFSAGMLTVSTRIHGNGSQQGKLHPTNIIFPFYHQLFLIFREAAESMAEKVATWRDLYGIDGVDLDIEVRVGQLHG